MAPDSGDVRCFAACFSCAVVEMGRIFNDLRPYHIQISEEYFFLDRFSN